MKISHEGMEPNKKWEQLILNPEKHEWERYSLFYVFREKEHSENLWNWSSSFLWPPSQCSQSPRWCKKAEDKNSLLHPCGTCLNLHSEFLGQHALWFHKGKLKRSEGVLRIYLVIVFFQRFWISCLDDFICLSTKSLFTWTLSHSEPFISGEDIWTKLWYAKINSRIKFTSHIRFLLSRQCLDWFL